MVGYGVLEHFAIVPHAPGDVPPPGGTTSTMGDVHELASYLGVIVILAVCLLHHVGRRAAKAALVVLAVLAMYVLFTSGTRSEYIALFVVLFGLLFWRPARRPAAAGMVAMIGIFVTPIFGYLFFPPRAVQQSDGTAINTGSLGQFYNVTVRFGDSSLVYSLGERFLHKWPSMIAATMRSPIVGLGPSAATEAADGYYIRTFVESGILGLLVFVGLIVTIFRTAIGAARRSAGLAHSMAIAAIAMTAFVALVGVLIDTWVSSRLMELYWPLLGVALGAVACQTERSESSIEVVGAQPVSAPSSV